MSSDPQPKGSLSELRELFRVLGEMNYPENQTALQKIVAWARERAFASTSDPQPSNAERLRERFAKLREDGLLDLKVWAPAAVGAPLEELCGEMLAILDAIEQEQFVDITGKIDEEKS